MRDDSIHSIGNGKFIIYGKGPEINQFQGPPYSVPAYGSFVFKEPTAETACESCRLKRENTWVHKIKNNEEIIAEFKDYIDPEYNVFIREFECKKDIYMNLSLYPHTETHVYDNYDFGLTKKDCVMLVIRKGVKYFTDFCLIEELRMFIIPEGDAEYIKNEKVFAFKQGKGRLLFISGTPGEITKHISFALTAENVYNRSKDFYDTFLKKGDHIRNLIKPDHPERERILNVLESTAICIKSQQSFDGGIIAGHYYPMAYVRDQAGTLRGLLKMGYIDEAKAVLDFWFMKFNTFGNLLNAESMGHNNDRLLFSNDEVEIPAYIVFCAFEYLNVTGDSEYLKHIFPMLKWAVKVQIPHLGNGMTGFSGDETYIAGGTFPREFIYHGSAESTLLFIEGTFKFISFSEAFDLLNNDELIYIKKNAEYAKQKYRENFFINGILYGNNPDREKYIKPPRYHRGFCVADILKNRPAPLMWLERGEHGYYRCPDCFNEKVDIVNNPNKRYLLGSVGLLPVYYHSNMFTDYEIENNITPFIKVFNEKGYIPSNIEGTRSLGYDFGLMLYNLVYIDNPLKEKALSVMLDMADATNVWVEYYDDKKAFNCRCRPWESAINIESLIYYLNNIKKKVGVL